VAISEALGNPTTVFEADGTQFADALSAGPAAAIAHGSILLTQGGTQSPDTSRYLARHPADNRVAIGGPAATADPTATAYDGSTRYQTSEAVAAAYFPHPTVVGLASGLVFADALAGGAELARLGGPILLTDANGMPPSVGAYLTANSSAITLAIIFGGTSALSAAFAGQVVTDH
jgi:putative cell wall-binding protein